MDNSNTKLELIEDKTHELIGDHNCITQESEEWRVLTNQLKELIIERSNWIENWINY